MSFSKQFTVKSKQEAIETLLADKSFPSNARHFATEAIDALPECYEDQKLVGSKIYVSITGHLYNGDPGDGGINKTSTLTIEVGQR